MDFLKNKKMKAIIKNGVVGLLAATAMLGNVACTDLLDESYGRVVSENYSPKTEEDISFLVNAAYIPCREVF